MSKLVQKPWGGYLIIEKTSEYWIKKHFVKKGEQLSLQSHKKRSELFIVIKGRVTIQKGKNIHTLKEGDLIEIEKNEKHRMSGIVDSYVLEIAIGKPRERDITRYEDKYGRK